MRILISGSHGFIGSALIPELIQSGHTVAQLVRSHTPNTILWNPTEGTIESQKLEGFDAVIHLAGENIATRWTPEKKRRIKDSRINGTHFLCNTLSRLNTPPSVLISASAVGFYGDQGEEILTEDHLPGVDFLSQVCLGWEEATKPAMDAGIRVINARLGVVLSQKEGALAQMLPIFRLGLGGILGTGKQFMSWVAIDDVIQGLIHCLHTDDLSGPVNLVSPTPLNNEEFTHILGKVISRPTWFRIPAFFIRFIFGEMGDAALLASTRVKPQKMYQSGYVFRYPDLESALRHELG